MSMPIERLLKCAQRELALRRNTYPKWAKMGKIKPEVAHEEIEAQENIVKLLYNLKLINDCYPETKSKIL